MERVNRYGLGNVILKGFFEIKEKDIYKKSEDKRIIRLSILLEDWATKKFDKDFNND